MNELGIGISAKAPDNLSLDNETPPLSPEGNVPMEIPSPPEPKSVYEPIVSFKKPNYTPNGFRNEAIRIVSENQTETDDSLRRMPHFLEAAKIINRKDYPDDYETMTDEEHSTTFLTKLNRNYYNITRAIGTAIEYDDASAEEASALAFGMEMYEHKDISWAGTAGSLWALGTDPFTLGTIMSLGTATVAREGAKRSVGMMIRRSLGKRMATLAAADAALFGMMDNTAQQYMKMSVGLQKDYNPLETAAVMGAAGLLGGGIYKGGQAIGKAFTKGAK